MFQVGHRFTCTVVFLRCVYFRTRPNSAISWSPRGKTRRCNILQLQFFEVITSSWCCWRQTTKQLQYGLVPRLLPTFSFTMAMYVLDIRTGSTNITAGAIFGHSNVGHVVTQQQPQTPRYFSRISVSYARLWCARPELCRKYLEYWDRLVQDPDKKDTEWDETMSKGTSRFMTSHFDMILQLNVFCIRNLVRKSPGAGRLQWEGLSLAIGRLEECGAFLSAAAFGVQVVESALNNFEECLKMPSMILNVL